MAINYQYDAAQGKANNEFELIPEGTYRARIEEAVEDVAKSGRDMVKIKLAVSGYKSHLWFYLVFLDGEHKKITDGNLYQLYNSFGIPSGNLEPSTWVGKTGAVVVSHEEYNGEMRARAKRFVSAEGLPAWSEGGNAAAPVAEPTPSATYPWD